MTDPTTDVLGQTDRPSTPADQLSSTVPLSDEQRDTLAAPGGRADDPDSFAQVQDGEGQAGGGARLDAGVDDRDPGALATPDDGAGTGTSYTDVYAEEHAEVEREGRADR